MNKLLSWIGALAVLGLCGVTATGLMLIKDRVRVVVQDDSAADATAQQVAQLKDDVLALQRDLRALADALAPGFRELADQQAAGLEALRADVAKAAMTQARDSVSVRNEQQRLAEVVASLHTAVAALPVLAPAHGAPPTPELAPELPPVLAVAPEVAPVITPPAAASTPEPAPRPRSAFAFTLPSQGFTFDLKQRFELLPSLSRVGFDAKSTLHDFTGVTSKLSGTLTLNLAAGGPCSGEIHVDAASLDTGLGGRNEAMREHLDSSKHPAIMFDLQELSATAVDATKQAVSATARGVMTIRGQSRAVAMPVRLSVDPSKRVHADGEVPLKLSDYGIPVPSQLGMIRMQDEVKVWIALQARALGAARAQ